MNLAPIISFIKKPIILIGFGICVFLASIGPFRDHQQGNLALSQIETDHLITRKIVALKSVERGYLSLSALEFDRLSLPKKTSWDARINVDVLPLGMGFFIEHAFASKDTCLAYLPKVAEENFDQIFVDDKLIVSKKTWKVTAHEACTSGQNAIRLVRLDPGEQQRKIAATLLEIRNNTIDPSTGRLKETRNSQDSLLRDPKIPGGYFVPQARPATPEELKAAETQAQRAR